MNKNIIRLSVTSGLNLFNECPRCFWFQYNKNIHRPRGIFPSLPGGMDGVIKKYFDKYRKEGLLPPELRGKVVGNLVLDITLLNKWRDWRRGLEYFDKARGAALCGALDDCLIDGESYVVIDYKTRGYPPKDGESERYYGAQLDTYTLLLKSNGYKTADFAYLIYYYPEEVSEGGTVKFNVTPIKIAVNHLRAKKLFESALDCLAGPAPRHHSSCVYCSWNADLKEFD